MNAEIEGELKDHAFVKFIQKRLQESLEENKRYQAKYVDMREFAYTSVEQLMKQLNARKKNAIQNSNLNVYKQLFDKERKQWLEEKEKVDEKVESLQDICHKQTNELKQSREQVKQMREEMRERDGCEAKVQEYVQTLIQKNKQLEEQKRNQ